MCKERKWFPSGSIITRFFRHKLHSILSGSPPDIAESYERILGLDSWHLPTEDFRRFSTLYTRGLEYGGSGDTGQILTVLSQTCWECLWLGESPLARTQVQPFCPKTRTSALNWLIMSRIHGYRKKRGACGWWKGGISSIHPFLAWCHQHGPATTPCKGCPDHRGPTESGI